MAAKQNKQDSARVRGIRRRWITNSVSVVLFMVVLCLIFLRQSRKQQKQNFYCTKKVHVYTLF